MKVKINGVEVEGTPEEVWALLQQANSQGTNLKPYQPMPNWNGGWWSIFPPDTIVPRVTGGSTGTPDYLQWFTETISNSFEPTASPSRRRQP